MMSKDDKQTMKLASMKSGLYTALAIVGFISIWTAFHVPGMVYGTKDAPLHVSYISSDEQSPINGALHMMKEKSIAGLRNQHTLYYGPVFAVLAVPAVGLDYVGKFLAGTVSSAESYKNRIIFDWGGILTWARFTAVVAGALGVVAVFLLFSTASFNPSGNKVLPFITSFLLASNFLYFEYSTFFRHWIFIVVFLLWELFFIVKILEGKNSKNKYFYWVGVGILIIASYGVSFLSLIYQVLWVPILLKWLIEKDYSQLKTFGFFALILAVGFLAITFWHPYALFRILGLVGSDLSNNTEAIAQGVVAQSASSFFFYMKLFFVNTIGILFSFLYILFSEVRRNVKKICTTWSTWGVLALPAFVHFAIFGSMSHHETRYFLPFVVLFVVLFGYVLSLYLHDILNNKRSRFFVGGLLVFGVTLSVLQIVGWQRVMIAGPVERQEIIPQLIEWQKENENARILIVKGWPVGYAHTKEAYHDYVERFNKSGYELWQHLLVVSAPAEVTPINVYYEHSLDTIEERIHDFDHVVVHHLPVVGEDIARESPMDEFDIRPWHLWNYEKYQESFTVIK